MSGEPSERESTLRHRERDHRPGIARRRNAMTKDAGAFIVVVGPDGVGKTTLADALLRARQGRYFHFRPPFMASTMERVPPHQAAPPTKDPGPAFPPLGWLRLTRNFVSTWIGYLTAVRPALSTGDLVVADRWLFGYLVQPRPLRYGGPEWLARLAIALLPSPDLVVNLTAPVEVITRRKKELPTTEIIRELEAWERLPVENLVTIDTTADIQDLTSAVFDQLSKGR